jgi:hypothetical protein
MSAKTPWLTPARQLHYSMVQNLRYEPGLECPEDASTAILAMIGLATLPECPAPFREATLDLEADGVWGPKAEAAYRFIIEAARTAESKT